MNGLLESLKNAQSGKSRWAIADVETLLKFLCKAIPNAQSDWERGDEMWARVLSGEEVSAIISVEMPLVILKGKHRYLADLLQNDLELFQVAVVEQFDEPALETSRDALEQIFNRSLSENLEYDSLSVDDLWWATVH
jgi:hypothetical protein